MAVMPTVRTNDVDTYYERRGTGPPVVFVHAAIMDHSQWAPQMADLSDEYTTIAYDVRGHGRTGGSAKDAYSVELFAEDLDALLTALDVERPVLCGHSMGGCVAQVYAARHPHQVSGLVLTDTFTPDLHSWQDKLPMALLGATVLPVRLIGYERVQKAKAWIHERFSEGASGDYEKVERLQADAPGMETGEFAKVVRSLTAFPATEVDLSRISVPTLVLYGENAPTFLRRQARKLAAGIPNASIRAVPGGGHASNLDNPEFFTTALWELLAQALPRDAPDRAGETGETAKSK